MGLYRWYGELMGLHERILTNWVTGGEKRFSFETLQSEVAHHDARVL